MEKIHSKYKRFSSLLETEDAAAEDVDEEIRNGNMRFILVRHNYYNIIL